MTSPSETIGADALDDSVALVVHDNYAPARIIGGIPHLEEYLLLADRISRTAMVPAALRNKPDEVLAVVMYGAELGIGPMQSLQQINFVAGKPSAAAELLRALVMEAGHQFILSGNGDEAIAQCRRKDWDEWRETRFTISDARRAGLTNGENWKKYPDQMLAARVTSKACRMYFPDCVSGMSYTAEEVVSFAPLASTSRHSNTSQNDELGDPASEEQMYALTTSIGLLDAQDKAHLKEVWIEAGLPVLARGLTFSQAEQATKLVLDVLSSVGEDVDDGEVVSQAESVTAVTDEVTAKPATKFQVTKIQTMLGKVGVDAFQKHDFVSEIVDRQIDSMNDLTKDEATTVIDHLTILESQAKDETK
jgi:hypothetical protein